MRVVRQFLLFGIILLGLNSILFLVYYDLYYKSYLDKAPTGNGFTTLVLSDSHGLALGQLLEDEGIWNFSAESDNYQDMRRKLVYVHKQNPGLKTVLLTVDDHTLSVYREQMNNEDRSVVFSSFSDEWTRNSSFGGTFSGYGISWLRYYLLILNPKSSGLIKRFASGKAQIFLKLRKENTSPEMPWCMNKDSTLLARSRSESQFPDHVTSIKMQEEVKWIIAYCRQNNLQLMGIKFPLTPMYDRFTAGKSYKADSCFVAENIPVLDYRQKFQNENHCLFKDQDHLNAEGGFWFARELKHDLLEIRK